MQLRPAESSSISMLNAVPVRIAARMTISRGSTFVSSGSRQRAPDSPARSHFGARGAGAGAGAAAPAGHLPIPDTPMGTCIGASRPRAERGSLYAADRRHHRADQPEQRDEDPDDEHHPVALAEGHDAQRDEQDDVENP